MVVPLPSSGGYVKPTLLGPLDGVDLYLWGYIFPGSSFPATVGFTLLSVRNRENSRNVVTSLNQ
jgi:hypothetical protein